MWYTASLIMLGLMITLFDFQSVDDLDTWRVVNDGVMGGVSTSTLVWTNDHCAKFSGTVSLENNGGFCSIQTDFTPRSVDAYSAVRLRVKGDGKRYQFRVKSQPDQWFSYAQYVQTSGDWETIVLPFHEFQPTFRGRSLDRPAYPGQSLGHLSVLIGNKRNESFQILIDSIALQ